MRVFNNKLIVIKLGDACNLNCKHCHNTSGSFEFNEDILPWLKKVDPLNICFSGGEPLIYWEYIKRIVDYLGDGRSYTITSNGTLLTPSIVAYCNKHNIRIDISYDGEGNKSRDNSSPVQWDLASVLKINGLSVLWSEENFDIEKLLQDIQGLKKRYNLKGKNYPTNWVNFVHELYEDTKEYDDLVQPYCDAIMMMCRRELDYAKVLCDTDLKFDSKKFRFFVLEHCIRKYIKPKHIEHGAMCCRDLSFGMSIDGKIKLCPYTTIEVGDIYKGIDWDLVDSMVPERCRTCPIWDECGNPCVASVTENECKIAKILNTEIKKLIEEYNIEYTTDEDFVTIFGRQFPKWGSGK